MSSTNNLWTDLPMSTGIATLVCYAGVFGDVMGIEEMAARLGATGNPQFYASLDELHRQGRLILRDGFAALPNLGDKICIKASKIETTRQLIASRMADIKKLGTSPLIKFVGICGSLAANNPTKDRNNHLDLDIFLITRSQCLWLYMISRGIRKLFSKREIEPALCINYVMDDLSLKVTNRNFYTATEIRNLIPVSGSDAYRRFLQANNWVDYYYPDFSGTTGENSLPSSGNLINKLSYILYSILLSIKHLSLEPIRKLTLDKNPLRGIKFNRISQIYGGYQGLVITKFTRLATTWFPDLLDATLVEKLFPDQFSAGIRKGEIDVFKLMEEKLGYDYSKYA